MHRSACLRQHDREEIWDPTISAFSTTSEMLGVLIIPSQRKAEAQGLSAQLTNSGYYSLCTYSGGFFSSVAHSLSLALSWSNEFHMPPFSPHQFLAFQVTKCPSLSSRQQETEVCSLSALNHNFTLFLVLLLLHLRSGMSED